MKLFKYILFATLIYAVNINSTFGQVPSGVKLAKNQELIRSNGNEPESLDPSLLESRVANNIVNDIFESLVGIDKDNKFIPAGAESWKRTTPTKWEFKLRQNAVFSNGRKVEAEDYVYAIRRYLDPKTASPYADTYGIFIKNGAEVMSGKLPTTALAVRAIDPLTLEIETVNPTPYFLGILLNCQFAPLPKEVIEKYGKDWIKPGNIVGNGPYVLKEWVVNNRVVLEKSPTYWNNDKVTITKVTFLPVEDQNGDVKLFESGESDYVYSLPVSNIADLKQKYASEYVNLPLLAIRYYSFNNADPILKDVRVRKALSMVVDRDILAEKVTNDGQVPSYSVIAKGISGADPSTYDWAAWPMARRITEAKKLLKAAGIKDGTTLDMVYDNGDIQRKISTFLASEWKSKLGINTNFQTMEFKALLTKRRAKDYQVTINRWYGDYDDATTFLILVQCGSTQNVQGNCNIAADAIFAQAELQADPAKRRALINKGVKMVMDDYPMMPLLQLTAPRLIKSYVGGYNLNPLDRHDTSFFYIKEN